MEAVLRRAARNPLVVLCVTMLTLVLVGWFFLTSRSQAGSGGVTDVIDAPPTSETITVGAPTSAPAIANGFLGFSIEYQSIAVDAGPASDPDTVFDQLVDGLNPGQRPIIRIGGDSTDHTWYPVAGVNDPGFTFALTPSWLSSVATFAEDANARLILGINLEADDPSIAETESRALLNGIGAANILQWEIGNEPNLYATFPWYLTTPGDNHSGFFTRTHSFTFGQYLQQYKRGGRRLARPAAGPARRWAPRCGWPSCPRCSRPTRTSPTSPITPIR